MKQSFIKGKSVILISSCNYNMHTKNMLNAQILAEEMAKRGVKVLFVESLGLKNIPLAGKSDITKVFLRLISFLKMIFKGLENPKENLWILSPVRIPFEKIKIIGMINRSLIKDLIKRYSKKLNMDNPILWIMLPTAHYLVGEFEESLSVYHCVDDYSEVPFVDTEFIKDQESQISKKVDLIFAVSQKMAKELKSLNKNTIYINNVARFNLFNKALTENIEIPKDIKNIVESNKAIVGFVGNLASYKEDIELLSKLAKNMSNISFVFIGPVGSGELSTNIESLKSLDNVHLLGPKDYWNIYKYFKSFDVALIARKLNKANEGGFPLKYFEYMAAGLPVVVTNVKTLHEFSLDSDLGGIANNSEEFETRINYWINLKNKDKETWNKLLEKRLKLARENSWEVRMEDFNKIIAENLNKFNKGEDEKS